MIKDLGHERAYRQERMARNELILSRFTKLISDVTISDRIKHKFLKMVVRPFTC